MIWKKNLEHKLSEAFRLMYKKSIDLGGLVSGEHGIGYAKKEYLLDQHGKYYIGLLENIRKHLTQSKS